MEARLGRPRLHPAAIPPKEALLTLEHDPLARRVGGPDVRETAIPGRDPALETAVAQRPVAVRDEITDIADATGVHPPARPHRERVDEEPLGERQRVQSPRRTVVFENALCVGDVDEPARVLRHRPVLSVPAGFLPRDLPGEQRTALGHGRWRLCGRPCRGEKEQERQAQHGRADRIGGRGTGSRIDGLHAGLRTRLTTRCIQCTSLSLCVSSGRGRSLSGVHAVTLTLSLLSRMKAFFCALVLGLGLTLAGGGQGGGSTTPKGDVQDITEAGGGQGGGSTTPKGDVQDIA